MYVCVYGICFPLRKHNIYIQYVCMYVCMYVYLIFFVFLFSEVGNWIKMSTHLCLSCRYTEAASTGSRKTRSWMLGLKTLPSYSPDWKNRVKRMIMIPTSKNCDYKWPFMYIHVCILYIYSRACIYMYVCPLYIFSCHPPLSFIVVPF